MPKIITKRVVADFIPPTCILPEVNKEQGDYITVEEILCRCLGCKGGRAVRYLKKLRSFNPWKFLIARHFQPYFLQNCDLAHFMVNSTYGQAPGIIVRIHQFISNSSSSCCSLKPDLIFLSPPHPLSSTVAGKSDLPQLAASILA